MIHRLGDVIGSAAFESAKQIAHRVGSGHDNHRDIRIANARFRQQIKSRRIGQVQIDQDQVGFILRE